jgi:hypothetical protein
VQLCDWLVVPQETVYTVLLCVEEPPQSLALSQTLHEPYDDTAGLHWLVLAGALLLKVFHSATVPSGINIALEPEFVMLLQSPLTHTVAVCPGSIRAA